MTAGNNNLSAVFSNHILMPSPMLDKIITTLTKKVGPRLTSEIGLTKENAEKSITLAGESAANVIQEETVKGRTSELADLFTKDTSQLSKNPIFTKIINHVFNQVELISQHYRCKGN